MMLIVKMLNIQYHCTAVQYGQYSRERFRNLLPTVLYGQVLEPVFWYSKVLYVLLSGQVLAGFLVQ